MSGSRYRPVRATTPFRADGALEAAIRETERVQAAREAADFVRRLEVAGRLDPRANPWVQVEEGLPFPENLREPRRARSVPDVRPRMSAPLSTVARTVGRVIARMHPLMRVIDVMLLVRELDEQLDGGGSVMRAHATVAGDPTAGGSLVTPAGWSTTWFTANVRPEPPGALGKRLGPYYVASPAVNQPYTFFLPGNVGPALTPDINADPWRVNGGTANIWTITTGEHAGTPQIFYSRYAAGRTQWQGPGTFDPAIHPVPYWQAADVQAAVRVFSPSMLGAPNELSEARDELGHFQLPGQVPPRRHLPWTHKEMVDDLRRAMGLRREAVSEVVRRVRTLAAQTALALARRAKQAGTPPGGAGSGREGFAPPPSPWEGALLCPVGAEQLVVGLSRTPSVWGSLLNLDQALEASPSGELIRIREDPHRWVNSRGRTKKLKLTGPVQAVAKMALNLFTESNDLIRGIWEALPRGARTAGMTASGQRRTDRMLRDIYWNWSRIDWREALHNICANQVEDAVIGRFNQLVNQHSRSSGVGLATQWSRATGQTEGAWMQGDQVEGMSPWDWLDNWFDQVKYSEGLERDPSDARRLRERVLGYPQFPQRDARGVTTWHIAEGGVWAVEGRLGADIDLAPTGPRAVRGSVAVPGGWVRRYGS